MKAIRNIFLALALLGTVSCGNDWLELDPSTAVNTDEAVKTLQEVEFTMNGIYNMMRTSDLYSGRMMYYGDVTGDDMQAVSSSKRTGSYYRLPSTTRRQAIRNVSLPSSPPTTKKTPIVLPVRRYFSTEFGLCRKTKRYFPPPLPWGLNSAIIPIAISTLPA